jgi:dinuclear metal center YbgI/SA1388 family protein
MDTRELITYLDNYLQIHSINDYGPQGLQVEASKKNVQRIALAVDSSPVSIEAAASWQADMLLVHHGLLWRDVERIAGPLGRRVRLLLQNNIHLYAAHLALDAHPEVGNNAILAGMLGAQVQDWWCDVMGTKIGVIASLDLPLENLLAKINAGLNSQARLLQHGPSTVRSLAVVSGFGADRVGEARAMGADTLLTGETSHANYWAAADHSLNVIFAGHYATETVGVRALGQHLSLEHGLTVQFFDFPTDM